MVPVMQKVSPVKEAVAEETADDFLFAGILIE